MVAVGAIVASYSTDRGPAQKVALAWTSDASGNVSGILTGSLAGVLTRFTTVPGLAGVKPTDNYDLTLLDSEGIDLLAGLGANRDDTLAESVAPMLGAGTNVPVVIVGPVQLVVTNAGNAKSGTAYLYLGRR